jgi:hypothetical protein
MMKFFKSNYYYLVAGLPDLLMDQGKVKVSVTEFKTEIEPYLDVHDFELIKILFLKFDNKNLLNLLQKQPVTFDTGGNYDQDFFEEQIKEQDDHLLPYLAGFIKNFKEGMRENEEISWENELETRYFQHLKNIKNDFLKEWFEFTLNIKNITTALNCRNYNFRPENELIGDNFVVQSILRSNSRDFGLMQEFPEIDKLLNIWEAGNLLEREKQIALIYWQWIDEHTFFHYFTIEKILGFMLQLEIVERWLSLDSQTGESMFRQLLYAIGKSFSLPDEFKLQHVSSK